MRAPAALALLLLSGCGGASAPAAPPSGETAPRPASPDEVPARIAELDHLDAGIRRSAADALARSGAAVLPALDEAGSGKGPLAARARALALRIRTELARKERAADDAFLASSPALPAAGRVVVAGGRLSSEEASRGAFHRYVWDAAEDRAPTRQELSSLAAGDAGRGLVAILGPGPYEIAPPGGGVPRPQRVSGNPELPGEVLVLEDRAARALGLARHAVPGDVTVTSRVGAGTLASAWRARARVRSGAGERDVLVWVVPDRGVLREEGGR